jgi:hypothetical protein
MGLPFPKTTKGRIKAVIAVLKSSPSNSRFAVQKVRARDFEEHAKKYYERKYGKKKVQTQKHSRHSRRNADIAVDY